MGQKTCVIHFRDDLRWLTTEFCRASFGFIFKEIGSFALTCLVALKHELKSRLVSNNTPFNYVLGAPRKPRLGFGFMLAYRSGIFAVHTMERESEVSSEV